MFRQFAEVLRYINVSENLKKATSLTAQKSHSLC